MAGVVAGVAATGVETWVVATDVAAGIVGIHVAASLAAAVVATSIAGSIDVAVGAAGTLAIELPLQATDPGQLPDWLVTFVRATDVLSALVGLFVAYLAYRGFRKNESRPMLFVAIGFAFALGVPFGLALLRAAVPSLPLTALAVVQQLSQLGGLLLIVYGLYAPERRRTASEGDVG